MLLKQIEADTENMRVLRGYEVRHKALKKYVDARLSLGITTSHFASMFRSQQ